MTQQITKTLAETMTVFVPNGDALLAISNDKLEAARGIVIDSADMANIAAGELSTLKGFINRLDAERKELVGPLNEVVKKINAKYKAPTELCEKGESIIKAALSDWNRKVMAAAEAERIRLLKAAEAEAKKLEQKAVKQEEKGNVEVAAALQQEAVSTLAVVQNLPTAAPKVAGISTRDNWKMACSNKLALVKFVAENPQYLDLLDFNASAGSKLAKALKDNLKIDGCTIFNDPVVASRAA